MPHEKILPIHYTQHEGHKNLVPAPSPSNVHLANGNAVIIQSILYGITCDGIPVVSSLVRKTWYVGKWVFIVVDSGVVYQTPSIATETQLLAN